MSIEFTKKKKIAYREMDTHLIQYNTTRRNPKLSIILQDPNNITQTEFKHKNINLKPQVIGYHETLINKPEEQNKAQALYEHKQCFQHNIVLTYCVNA